MTAATKVTRIRLDLATGDPVMYMDQRGRRIDATLLESIGDGRSRVLSPDGRQILEVADADLEKRVARALKLKSLSDGINEPVPRRVVGDLMREAELGALFGPPGTAKTFIMLSMSLAIANGDSDWFGERITSGHVVYIVGEGRGGLNQRLRACFPSSIEGSPDEQPAGSRFHYLDQAVRFLDDDNFSALVETLRALPEPPKLVVVDTLNRALLGGSENDDGDMGTVIARCQEIIDEFGSCVVLIHHSGKDSAKGLRGHSSLLGAVHFSIAVAEAGEDSGAKVVSLSSSKSKDTAGIDESIRIALDVVGTGLEDPDTGEEITSCRPRRVTFAGGELRHPVLTPAAVVVVTALDDKLDPAGVSAKEISTATKIPRTSLYRALKQAAEEGYVKEQSRGTWTQYVRTDRELWEAPEIGDWGCE